MTYSALLGIAGAGSYAILPARDGIWVFIPCRTSGLSACLWLVNKVGKLSVFLFIPGLVQEETRLHGSKHGDPASADAARPQGSNDQFSTGPD